MAISNKSNVIKRSDKVTPLTQPEVDQNFQEIRNVIDDTTQLESEYNAYVISNDSRVDTLTLNIGSVDDKVDGLEFGDIAGTATAEQVPNLDASKITTGTLNADRVPNIDTLNGDLTDTQLGRAPLLTNHVRAGNMQIQDGSMSLDFLNVKTFGTEGSWITVGPTDSEADYILTQLDDLPSSATILILAIRLFVEPFGGGYGWASVNLASGTLANPPGIGTPYSSGVDATLLGATLSSTSDKVASQSDVMVGLDANNIFKIRWLDSMVETSSILIRYTGFLTD